jgi:hypothetical protein
MASAGNRKGSSNKYREKKLTQNTGGYPPSGEGPATQQATVQIAKEEAANVGQSARDAGANVTSTAAEQARNVIDETRRQASGLLEQARSQVGQQVSAQQRKAAGNLHTLASQLNDMAAKSGDAGVAAQLAEEASSRADGIASWLERRQPADLLDDVRDFARRRPGTFLLGAVLAGALAGRMTRGATAAARSGGSGAPGQFSGASADGSARPVAQSAEPLPAPASASTTTAGMPSPETAPGTEYGSPGTVPGTGYGSDLPPADYGRPDLGDDYSYRPGHP